MPTPNVSVSKNPFSLGALPASPDGIVAYICDAPQGDNLPGNFTNPQNVTQKYGNYGQMSENAAYHMPNSGRGIVAMRPAALSTAASYGTIVHTGVLGTMVPAAGATHPADHYGVIVTFINPGTVGTTGITYTYSLDGGVTTSGVQSLGTANVLTIPNSGVSFALGAGTVLAGDTFSCWTDHAYMNDADASTALTTLDQANLAWEMVFLDWTISAGTIGALDTILAGWEAKGKFKIGILNTPFKLEPQPTTETEAAYLTRMTTLIGSQSSERIVVGADGGHVSSSITGWYLKRTTALFTAARAASLTPNIGTSPNYVNSGPLPGVGITAPNGGPLDHNEYPFPGLDDLSFTTLRTFADNDPAGVYLTHANILSPNNSDIQYLQQLRVLNKACAITYKILVTQLGLGVRPEVNQAGVLVISENDAQKIEGLVNPQLVGSLGSQCTSIAFVLSRSDNLQANPVVLSGNVNVVGFVYVDGFNVVTAFTKPLSAAA